jgi:hypothetical protein
MANAPLAAMAEALKAPEPVKIESKPEPEPFNPFAIWSGTIAGMMSAWAAPAKPAPAPSAFDPFGVLSVMTSATTPTAPWTQSPWSLTPWGASAWLSGAPMMTAWLNLMTPVAVPFPANPFWTTPALAQSSVIASPLLAFWSVAMAPRQRPASPDEVVLEAMQTTALYPVYAAYRSAGGHAVAQIVAPVTDTLTAMARMNPVVSALLPPPAPAMPFSALAMLSPWRFFKA